MKPLPKNEQNPYTDQESLLISGNRQKNDQIKTQSKSFHVDPEILEQ